MSGRWVILAIVGGLILLAWVKLHKATGQTKRRFKPWQPVK